MNYAVRLNSTSKGVLYKGITQDGKLYFKAGFCDEYGDFENHSVKSECIAYEIGKALGLDVLKQELSYSGDVLTCKSENFLKPGESLITLAKLGIHTYEMLLNQLPEFVDYFNSILIFDFIINNIDRHLNNLALIVDENGEFRTPPIFDNGSSLYFDLNPEQLDYSINNPYGFKKFALAKPFNRKHYTQIKLVEESGILPHLTLNFNVSDIVEKYYSGLRGEAIINMVNSRLEYIKMLYAVNSVSFDNLISSNHLASSDNSAKPDSFKDEFCFNNIPEEFPSVSSVVIHASPEVTYTPPVITHTSPGVTLPSHCDTFILMYKDEEIGNLCYDEYNYFLHITNYDLDWFKYPPIWDNYLNYNVKEPYNNRKLKDFIEDKVVPECRSKEVVEQLGLAVYDCWEILKLTRGVTVDDYWWLAKPGDKYKDYHIKFLWDESNSAKPV